MGHNALKIMLNGYVDKVFKHKVSLKVHNKITKPYLRGHLLMPKLLFRIIQTVGSKQV